MQELGLAHLDKEMEIKLIIAVGAAVVVSYMAGKVYKRWRDKYDCKQEDSKKLSYQKRRIEQIIKTMNL